MGAIENWVKLQDKHECFFFIADLHALTSSYDETKMLKNIVKNVVLDLLAAGIDPKKSVLFRQSYLPEHAELHLMFSMITPIPWLERVPTYKSKIAELKQKDLGTYGFLGYPVLQAADILMYKADGVPVGQDQLPHIELTREIARRFNHFYGNVFSEPKEMLTDFSVLPGLDGRKMSKSYHNTIDISDSTESIRKKVSTMITDPARVKKEDKGHPEVCSVYEFYKVFGKNRTDTVAQECRAAKRGCVACKNELAAVLVDYLEPIHKKRRELGKDPKKLEAVLVEGEKRAKKIAAKTLAEAKTAMGII
ncbi:MAG: tryptophan--tRNA ligase [Candidatus Margulisiibacteriota bacterium]|nr:tryptophan--tRNA ligase [Candidatus Margulisiibacteriota bacterium]